MLVEPCRARRADPPRIRGVADLDPVDGAARLPIAREPAERAFTDREREVGERMRDDGQPAGVVDAGDRLVEGAQHRDLVLDPQSEQMPGPCGDLDAGNHLDGARSARGDVPQGEGPSDVVVIRERDDVETGSLGRVKDLLRRRQPVAEIAVKLEVGPAH
jgi:hypothetical protein